MLEAGFVSCLHLWVHFSCFSSQLGAILARSHQGFEVLFFRRVKWRRSVSRAFSHSIHGECGLHNGLKLLTLRNILPFLSWSWQLRSEIFFKYYIAWLALYDDSFSSSIYSYTFKLQWRISSQSIWYCVFFSARMRWKKRLWDLLSAFLKRC